MSDSTPPTKNADPRFVVHGLLPEGRVSLLLVTDERDIPIFALSMVAKIQAGAPFLGLPTAKSSVVYARDNMGRSFLRKAMEFGVKPSAFITGYPAVPASGLLRLVEFAIQMATDREAQVLVLDIPYRCELGRDSARLFKLYRDAANRGFAVLLVANLGPTHDSSQGGSEVISTGFADQVILLEASSRGENDPFGRRLSTVGSLAPALPDSVLLSITEAGCELVGPPSSPTGTVGGSS